MKNRIIGAIVLMALAVIFLPMLVQGPAVDSGVSDVSMEVPKAPVGKPTVRELPLVLPTKGEAESANGVSLPVDVSHQLVTQQVDASETALPASIAGGDYAITFGVYASLADATVVIDRLSSAGLEAFSQTEVLNGRPVWRVYVGPYTNRSQAEIARLAAVKVRNDVKVEVVVLDAEIGSKKQASTVPKPVTQPAQVKPKAVPAKTAAQPAKPKPAVANVPKTAANAVGFVLQVAAFSKQSDANHLRDALRRNGFSAFVEPVRSANGGQLFRVRVGPATTRGEAEQLKVQVAARNKLEGIIQPYP